MEQTKPLRDKTASNITAEAIKVVGLKNKLRRTMHNTEDITMAPTSFSWRVHSIRLSSPHCFPSDFKSAKMSAAGFLDQFSDQLKQSENGANQAASGQDGQQYYGGGDQGGWTQEQIAAYYAQYGGYNNGTYDYSQYYAQGGDQMQQQQQYGAADQTQYAQAGYAYGDQQSQGYGDQSQYNSDQAFGYSNPSYQRAAEAGRYGRPGRPFGGSDPTKSVWVGNIHPDTTDADLHAAFGRFGAIESIKLLTQKNCAFVKYADLDAAVSAHTQMQGAPMHGQNLRVGWGKPDPVAQREEMGPPPCRNLWLGNVGVDVTEEIIRNTFGQFGIIDKVRLLPQKNCAFVNFMSLDAAVRAKQQMSGAMLGDRAVKINFGKESGGGGLGLEELRPDYSLPGMRKQAEPDPAPPQQPPPSDAQTLKYIDTLCEFVAKNGPSFEILTRERQKDNPRFSFLKEGDGNNGYYKWKLWRTKNPNADLEPPKQNYAAVPPPNFDNGGQSHGQFNNNANSGYSGQGHNYNSAPPPPQYQNQGHQQGGHQQNFAPSYQNQGHQQGGHQQNYGQEDETIKQLQGLLDTLSPTKESIKVTKNWIMGQQTRIRDITNAIRNRVERSNDFDQKQNIVYLLHDILYHSFRNRKEPNELDEISAALEPHLGPILRSSVQGQGPENQEKIFKVFKLWEEKKIFEPATLARMEEEMRSSGRSSRGGFDDRGDRRDYRDRDGGRRDDRRDDRREDRRDDRRGDDRRDDRRKRSRERDYDKYDSKRRY
eukprot:TRINITY_DN1904_c0_g1_i2.p1 TRINITY_DN1904_c0_g1~~TRINITY_DN1904_c0_g1_i2.p1  ORF type:complete len:763 (-),score=214.92 TRINITY_DN1904_c0_g1_i2:153-2441(-)